MDALFIGWMVKGPFRNRDVYTRKEMGNHLSGRRPSQEYNRDTSSQDRIFFSSLMAALVSPIQSKITMQLRACTLQ